MRKTLLLLATLLLPGFASATTLIAGCGNSIPPYVLPQNDRGMALDVLRHALATQGYQLDFSYDSNANNVKAFNAGKIDITCISNSATSPDAYFSAQPLMVLHNMAISLAENGSGLASINDLSNYRVIGFNLAHKFLPAPYADAVSKSPEYKEEAEQIKQVEALFRGTTDVIVMDQTVFRYFLSKLRRSNPSDSSLRREYRYSNLFQPTYYYASFHSAAIRDAFDDGLKILKDSGDYEKLMAGYDKMLADYLFR
ncbi:substrate-binding periplasmic protein [Thalassolituus sp. LLYu03]|uniref:substrate-binding periplasmic protein n=1 Tax=Thalassolituus sp. LLYu03 TaxID=3421656 RepID=UPI003D2BE8DD